MNRFRNLPLHRKLSRILTVQGVVVASVTAAMCAAIEATSPADHVLVVLTSGAAVVIAAWMLAPRLSRPVVEPIEQLAGIARVSALGESRSMRAEPRSSDEVGRLVATVNAMLDRLHDRDCALRETRDEARSEVERLEGRVEDLHAASARSALATDEARDFLTRICREIHTPLCGVTDIADSLLADDDADEFAPPLKIIRATAGSLLDLVEGLREFGEIEAGTLEIRPRRLRLRECLEETIDAAVTHAKKRETDLVASVGEDVPDHIVGDAKRIRQILDGLISNAIKFSVGGKVTVRVEREVGVDETAPQRVWLCFTVTDTGIGIPRDRLDGLFDVFSNTSRSGAGVFGATCLGLGIVRGLVEGMGGTIEVESEVARGSKFRFVLPFEVWGDEKGSSVAADLARNNLIVLKTMEDHRPESAAQRTEQGSWIEKPIQSTVLRERVTRALEERQLTLERPQPMQPTQNKPQHPMNILLAEDNPVNQKLTIRMLEKRGHRVDLAENGRIAVEMYEAQAYDLILMDVMMPEMDGLESTSAIRELENRNGRHIPIVALTANAMKGDRERCLEYGMDDYLSKPIRPADLYEAVEKFMEPDATPSDASTSNAAGGADAGQTEVFDRPRMLERLGDDNELLEEILELFVVDAPSQMQNLEEAIATGEAELVTRHAHTLKGQAANIAANKMREASYAVEQAGKSGDIGKATELLPEMRSTFDELLSILRS